MTLRVEVVVDGGMGGKETLSRYSGFEPLHLSLASSDRLMGVLGPVVLAESLLLACCQAGLAKRRPVRAQLVGHQKLGSDAGFPEQLTHMTDGGLPRSNIRSSTFCSESGKRMYIITARRITSGDR